jgi:hypothetical protein
MPRRNSAPPDSADASRAASAVPVVPLDVDEVAAEFRRQGYTYKDLVAAIIELRAESRAERRRLFDRIYELSDKLRARNRKRDDEWARDMYKARVADPARWTWKALAEHFYGARKHWGAARSAVQRFEAVIKDVAATLHAVDQINGCPMTAEARRSFWLDRFGIDPPRCAE